MKVVLQRCKTASVKVDKKIVGKINGGLLILVAFTSEEDITNIPYMVDKIINLRIFDDENGVMNKSLLDIKGEILSVSQFTLYADTKKGRRPSYIDALAGDKAIKLYEKFNKEFTKYNIEPQTGIFGADMEVSLINDGPVTIIIEK